MAIRKKGSRRISVDGQDYLWRIRRKPTYTQAVMWSGMSIAVESDQPPHSVLIVTLQRPRPDTWMSENSEAVTPQDVTSWIRAALSDGWNPSNSSQQYQFVPNAESAR